jgi:4,5-DOPA dioxygenase extradiol
MKSLFLCHGAPDIILEDNEYISLLKEMGSKHRPNAIIIFSAHWEEQTTTISSVAGRYEMIYDFYGFPEELYRREYPAEGSPELALRIQKLFSKSGIESHLDTKRGIDHGTWTILSMMYPKADIPVVQISINPFRTMDEQFRIGKALKSLSEEDILVIGSGSTVHNLSSLDPLAKKPEDWAVQFDDWLIDKVMHHQLEQLYDYQKIAPHVKKAVPREEHIVPMFIAMGCGQLEQPKLLHRSYQYGTLTYLGFEF